MREPKRHANQKPPALRDPLITQAKFDEHKAKLARLLSQRPAAAQEVARLAEMGDFSENAAYQMAKGRLRSINYRILELEDTLKHSNIVQANLNTDYVQVGHTVVVDLNGRQKTFKILGSSETNPGQGVISRNSPIGEALLGEKVGAEVEIPLNNRTSKFKIISIS
mgnify:CR=1 FL=1|jgi:transcription elongation factor GreA